MNFDALYRRIDAYLKKARDQALVVTRLPHIVMRAEWAGGKETPTYRDMRALIAGKVPLHDFEGYEENNSRYENLQFVGRPIEPKLYLNFDTDAEEGADDRPTEEDDELTFEEYP